MPRTNAPLLSFNRGLISPLALGRVDIGRTALSAQEQTNWVPRVLGSMMLRPGFQYLSSSNGDNKAFHVPFVFARDDKALIEFTDTKLRVYVSDSIIERPSVATTVTNGDFSSDVGWTDFDESGATSTITGGKLELVGTGFNGAGRKREVTVAVGDQNTEHGIRIVVERGPVVFRCGSSDGDDDYISQTTLGNGTHSLSITPTGNFWIQFQGFREAKSIVDSVTVEASGDMEIDTPYTETDLPFIRYDQSADVIYIACEGYQQRKIERRSTRSWSLVLYEPEDGPFQLINTDKTTITASDLNGDITLTASQKIFTQSSVGALYEIGSVGQKVEGSFSGEDQFTDAIRVTGVDAQRQFRYTTTGTWVGRFTLQRSVGEPGAWVDVQDWSSNRNAIFDDELDNQDIYYRIGFKAGDYTSGTAEMSLEYSNGSIFGIAKVTGFTSETEVSAAVLVPLGGTDATTNWSEGEWSDRRGWPSAVVLMQGRLWWGGKTKIIGSVSDAFESFSLDVEGDSGVINRSIGSGPVDRINFLERLKRLVIGTDGAEWVAQSSSLDEPLTPTNFNLDDPSTQGSASVDSVKIDRRCLFVQSSGKAVYQISPDDSDVYGDFNSADLMELAPEVGAAGILRMNVQRQPDTRVHCVRGDGKVAVLISQPAEDVLCWIEVETEGTVEDVVVLPGDEEDEVYYSVKRTINGQTKRFLEKWAMESECQGGALNKQADSFIVYDGSATDTITGLGHLEGEEVVVWADGRALDNAVVSGGQIVLTGENIQKAIVGLFYESRFRSAKMAYAAAQGTALSQRKKIDHLGLLLYNTYYQGLLMGNSLEKDVSGNYPDLYPLPLVDNEAPITDPFLYEEKEMDMLEFADEWSTDSRVCLVAQAPNPCTVLAAIAGMNTNG